MCEVNRSETSRDCDFVVAVSLEPDTDKTSFPLIYGSAIKSVNLNHTYRPKEKRDNMGGKAYRKLYGRHDEQRVDNCRSPRKWVKSR